jgi:hypothetical protein
VTAGDTLIYVKAPMQRLSGGVTRRIAASGFGESATERHPESSRWKGVEMSDQNNSEYFASRAVAERLMGDFATDPRAAAIHAELAARYEELALEFDTADERRTGTG